MKKIVSIYIVLIITIVFSIGCTRKNSEDDIDRLNKNIQLKEVITIEKPIDICGRIHNSNYVVLSHGENINESSYIEIYDSNLKKVLKTIQPCSKNKSIYSVSVSENLIYWAEATNDLIKEDWDIYVYDNNLNKVNKVDSGKVKFEDLNLPNETLLGPILSSSDNKLCWSTFEEKNNKFICSLNIFNYKDKSIQRLDEIDIKDGNFGHPKISKEYVLYDKGKINIEKREKYGEICLLNLETNKKEKLYENFNTIAENINYPYAIYKKDKSSIIAYDIKSKKETIINMGNYNEVWNLTLNNQLLSWYSIESKLKIYSLKHNEYINLDYNCINGGNINKDVLWWISKENETLNTNIITGI